MSPTVVVIGGGFAGLSAAVALADRGLQVTLLESRPTLGGRARSFIDPATKEAVDNGQHLFLAGYRETLQFLRRLGTARNLIFQDRLQVTFIEPPGKVSRFDCPTFASPWHFLVGLACFSGLSLQDKLGLWRMWRSIASHPSPPLSGEREFDDLSVEEWLTHLRQSQRARRTFWYPLAIATLNEDPTRASARGLVAVLKTLVFASARDACLGVPSVGLSSLYAESAREVIERAGGGVLLNSPVETLTFEGDSLREICLVNGQKISADFCVSAVPPNILSKMLPPSIKEQDPAFSGLDRFASSPIVSVNLWLDRPLTEDLFVGMIGTRFQWFFNKPVILAKAGLPAGQAGIEARYVALILSAAHAWIDQPNEALVEMAMEDLKACFPKARQAQLVRAQVVREREATVSLGCGMEHYRPGPVTRFSNFFLAGDWTATGLPATIESAVLSGKRAAQALLQGVQIPR